MPDKYRERSPTIEAIQWTGDNEAACLEFMEGRAGCGRLSDPSRDHLCVHTNNIYVNIPPGYWVVKRRPEWPFGIYTPEEFGRVFEPIGGAQ